MQATYFLNGSMFDLLFYRHIILYWEKVTTYEKFSHNLTFEVQVFWKISALYNYCWKYRNTEKYLKNCKTFYETQSARKLFSLSPPHIPPDKILLRLCSKHFLREIYRNIQTFAFKVLQESSSWASGNGAVQMFFLTPNRSIFPGKFVNWENILTVFWEHIIFNFKEAAIWKISEVFLSETVL